MQHLATKTTAVFFTFLGFYLYSIQPWLMLFMIAIAWSFWRLPKVFSDTSTAGKNKKVGFVLLLILMSMTVFAYLMVPLFHKMCHELDIGGKVHNYQGTVSKTNKISNIEAYPVTNLYAGVPIKIDLAPRVTKLPMHGEFKHVFVLTNTSSTPLAVRLRLTMSPSSATHYIREVTKYNNNLLKFTAKEKKRLIVTYNIDKTIDSSIPSVAMAYTFFEFKE